MKNFIKSLIATSVISASPCVLAASPPDECFVSIPKTIYKWQGTKQELKTEHKIVITNNSPMTERYYIAYMNYFDGKENWRHESAVYVATGQTYTETFYLSNIVYMSQGTHSVQVSNKIVANSGGTPIRCSITKNIEVKT